MSAIYLLIPISLVVAAGFLAAFIWAVRSGQYDDTLTPSLRILAEDGKRTGDGPAHGRQKPATTHDERRDLQIRQ